MLAERVSCIKGKEAVLIIAPHGKDDLYISRIVKELSEILLCYAVINNGWKCGPEVDYKNEIATCSNLYHANRFVIKEEFLDPIRRFKHEIMKKNKMMFVFNIQGASNEVKKVVNDKKLAYIIGRGNGSPSSHTCQDWVKDFMIYDLGIRDKQYHTYEGKGGGSYAAWHRTSLTQFFTRWEPDERVEMMQLNIVQDVRYSKQSAEATAQVLSIVIGDLLERTSGWNSPRSFKTIQI